MNTAETLLSAEGLEERAAYYSKWAEDIRKLNGKSVDADHSEQTAFVLRALLANAQAQSSRIEQLERELAEAREWSRLCGKDLMTLGKAVGAARSFLDKLTECQPHIDGMFQFAWVHGVKYAGPNYAAERDTLEAALTDAGLPTGISREHASSDMRNEMRDPGGKLESEVRPESGEGPANGERED